MWEVPLMACLSELYFTVVNTDWDYAGQPGKSSIQTMSLNLICGRAEEAYAKGKILAESDCIISEFGTRRRRSYRIQDLVVGELIKAYKNTPSSRGRLAGTSNVRQRWLNPLNTSSNTGTGSPGSTTRYSTHWNDCPVGGFLIQPRYEPDKHLLASGSWGLPLLGDMRTQMGERWISGRRYIPMPSL